MPLTNAEKKIFYEKNEMNKDLTNEGDKLYEKHNDEFNIFVIVDI